MPSRRCVSVWMTTWKIYINTGFQTLCSFSCINIFEDILHFLKSNWVITVCSHLLLFCLLQEQGAKPASQPSSTQADPVPVAPAEPPAEVADETWEEKEDKQNAEPDRPKATPEPTGQKYQYKEGRLWPQCLEMALWKFLCSWTVITAILKYTGR